MWHTLDRISSKKHFSVYRRALITLNRNTSLYIMYAVQGSMKNIFQQQNLERSICNLKLSVHREKNKTAIDCIDILSNITFLIKSVRCQI